MRTTIILAIYAISRLIAKIAITLAVAAYWYELISGLISKVVLASLIIWTLLGLLEDANQVGLSFDKEYGKKKSM